MHRRREARLQATIRRKGAQRKPQSDSVTSLVQRAMAALSYDSDVLTDDEDEDTQRLNILRRFAVVHKEACYPGRCALAEQFQKGQELCAVIPEADWWQRILLG